MDLPLNEKVRRPTRLKGKALGQVLNDGGRLRGNVGQQ